jgi:transcriptional regulator with XRE-family HTH domain
MTPAPRPQILRLVEATQPRSLFASKVLRARTEQGFSQRDIETLTNGRVSRRTVSRWETALSVARPGATLRAYAEVTNHVPGWFFTEEE